MSTNPATPATNGTANGHTTPHDPYSAFRTPAPDPRTIQAVLDRLSTNAYSMRREILNRLIDPRRNIEAECGYPQNGDWIPPQLYQNLYDREPIAARVVDVFPKEAWQTTPSVFESEKKGKTPFDQAWKELSKQLRGEKCFYQDEIGSPVWDYLKRANILSGIGSFGIILLGLDDGGSLDQPVISAELAAQAANQKRKTKRKISWQAMMALNKQVAMERPQTVMFKPVKLKGRDLEGVEVEREIVTNEQASARNAHLVAAAKLWAKKDKTLTANAVDSVAPAVIQPGYGRGVPADDDWVMRQYAEVGTEALYQPAGFSPLGPGEEHKSGPPKLLFLRVFPESLVQIVQYESNSRSPRFGQPVRYLVTLNDPRDQHAGIGLALATVYVHWTRIIHIADNLESSEAIGVPRMRPVLNRLIDLQKLYGGSAEMYWRGAFPGLVAESQPGSDIVTDMADMRNQLENWTNSLQRAMATAGWTFRMLSPTVVDPGSQINVQLEAICIKMGIPKRVFMGSERGELASSQDDSAWNDRLREYRDNYITPRIITPFVDRLIAVGVLPEPKGYSIKWEDLESHDEQTKAQIAATTVGTLASYANGGVETVLPLRRLYTDVLKMEDSQADAIIDELVKSQEQGMMTPSADQQQTEAATAKLQAEQMQAEGQPVEATPEEQAAQASEQTMIQDQASQSSLQTMLMEEEVKQAQIQTKQMAKGPPAQKKPAANARKKSNKQGTFVQNPFKSKAQRRFMYATDPELAKEFEKKTKGKKLPERVRNVLEKILAYRAKEKQSA